MPVAVEDGGARHPDVDRLRRSPCPTGSRSRSCPAQELGELLAAKLDRAGSARTAVERAADQLLARIAQGLQQRVVALEEPAVCVEAEVHRRRVLIEVAVAVLQLLELAVDLPELVVDLGQLAGPEPQFALGPDLGGDVGDVAAEVATVMSGP